MGNRADPELLAGVCCPTREPFSGMMNAFVILIDDKARKLETYRAVPPFEGLNSFEWEHATLASSCLFFPPELESRMLPRLRHSL